RTTERDGEAAVEASPLLAGAAGEADDLVDAFQVHVGDARLGIAHAGTVGHVELGRPLRRLDADAGEVGEVLLDAGAALLPPGLELARETIRPTGEVAAVSVRVDHMIAKASHGCRLLT